MDPSHTATYRKLIAVLEQYGVRERYVSEYRTLNTTIMWDVALPFPALSAIRDSLWDMFGGTSVPDDWDEMEVWELVEYIDEHPE